MDDQQLRIDVQAMMDAGVAREKILKHINEVDAGWQPPDVDPGFMAQASAALADTSDGRRNAFASALDLPPDQLQQQGNDLFTPEGAKVEQGGFLAHLAGKAPTIAGGVLAPAALSALRGAPAGPWGMLASGVVGAMSGEAIRQAAGKGLHNDPFSAKEVALEGLLEGAGTVLVGLGRKALSARKLARDIASYDKPDAMRLLNLGRSRGIDLTPAEVTNMGSLVQEQKLVSKMPTSVDTMREFFEKRRRQIETALGDYLEGISTIRSVHEGGERGIKAAQDWIASQKELRGNAVEGLYQQAFSSAAPVDTSAAIRVIHSQLDQLPRKSDVAGSLRKVYSDLFDEVTDASGKRRVAISDLRRLDNVKKMLLDPEIENATRRGDQNAVRILQGVKAELVDAMTSASDDYHDALRTFESMSEPINEAEQGLLGTLARMQDQSAMKAARRIFSSETSSPEYVLKVRLALQQQDPEAWNGLLRAYMQDTVERQLKEVASESAQHNIGGRVAKTLAGSKRQRDILRSAMTPEQVAAYDDLMEVLQASGRAIDSGSDTALKQAGQREIGRHGSLGLLSDVVGAGTSLGKLVSPGSWSDSLAQQRTRSGARSIAKAITDPDALHRLAALRLLPEGQRYGAMSSLLAEIGSRPIIEYIGMEQKKRPPGIGESLQMMQLAR